jgi:hypothetical protein
MNGTSTGIYLGRPVILKELPELDELATDDDVSHAVVLLWLDRKHWDGRQLEEAIKRLASTNVLNITIAGWRADEAFSMLLTVLAPLPTNKHIMTGVISDTDIKDPIEGSLMIKDAVETFLVSCWPDEERFDDWTEYQIVVIGRPDLAREIRHSVIEIVNRKFSPA